jgi:hypothetical protein
MQVTFVAPGTAGSAAWVLGIADGGVLTPAAARINRELGGALKRAMEVARFTGRPAKILEVLAPQGSAYFARRPR